MVASAPTQSVAAMGSDTACPQEVSSLLKLAETSRQKCLQTHLPAEIYERDLHSVHFSLSAIPDEAAS